MGTEREGEFAAVVQVVLDHVPGHPLAREFVWLAIVLAPENIVHIFRRPTLQTVLPSARCDLQAMHKFGGRWYITVVFPPCDSLHICVQGTFTYRQLQP